MWASTWQNQQSDCAPSEDSDQPGHPPSLIRVFAVRMKKAWVLRQSSYKAEPVHDKNNKMICAPSLIRVFAVRMKKHWDLSYPLSVQRSLWSVRADAQADLKLRWAHMSFCWFCRAAAQIVYCKYLVRIRSSTFWVISIFLDIDLFFFYLWTDFFLYFLQHVLILSKGQHQSC